MTTLIVGASGATGKLLVDQLVESGQKVKIIVRSTITIPEHWNSNHKVTIINRNITEISIAEMSEYISDCQAVASCLGHNITLKGVFGKPQRLVTDTVRLICEAILVNTPEKPVRFVLMNTAGNRNRDLGEPVSIRQKIVSGLLRFILPPHTDNEHAADFLRVKIGQQHPYLEWTAVRPDTLIDEEKVSEYSLYKSPTRSAIFNPGKTSRINVGHFMSRLILDDDVWNRWQGQMPVIYNATE
jgi:putative NADH-flavin reductase